MTGVVFGWRGHLGGRRRVMVLGKDGRRLAIYDAGIFRRLECGSRWLGRRSHERLTIPLEPGDAKHSDVLAMAIPAAAVLPAALLEDDNLVQPVLRDHGRGDRGARHGR